jgi:rfaE bifunctional protein nucleotidyltransferase chain/domain
MFVRDFEFFLERNRLGCVISQDELILRRGEWKRNGKSVVFAYGRFDLLHPGHIRLLEQARSNGDVFVVGIESDAIAHEKAAHGASGTPSPQHPITPAAERAEIVAALAAVDYAVKFEATAARELLARLAPDVIVKGGEAGSEESVFRDDEASAAAGSRVIRIPLEPGHSTSRLIERIKNTSA